MANYKVAFNNSLWSFQAQLNIENEQVTDPFGKDRAGVYEKVIDMLGENFKQGDPKKALEKTVLFCQEALWNEIKISKEDSREVKGATYLNAIHSLNDHFGKKYHSCEVLDLKKLDKKRTKPYK